MVKFSQTFNRRVVLPEMPAQQECWSKTLHCLHISEIYEIVVRCLYDSGRGRGSVASLSLTCKDLHHQAIAVLWEEMNSILPFIKLLPRHTFFEVERRNGQRSLDFRWGHWTQRPDLRRLEHYVRLVKHFTWDNNLDVTPGALEYLSKNLRSTPACLFPHVRSFHWSTARGRSVDPTGMLWKDALLSRNLRDIRFAGSAEDSKMISRVLDAAMDLASPSEVLHITTPGLPHSASRPVPGKWESPFHGRLTAKLSKFICHVNLVEFRSTCPIAAVGVAALAEMPSLRWVEFRPSPLSLRKFCEGILSADAFPCVKVFKMHIDAIDWFSHSFLHSVQSTQISQFALWTDEHPRPDHLYAHLSLLRDAPFASALRQVYVYGAAHDELNLPSPQPRTTLAILQPLVDMPWLTDIVVYAALLEFSEEELHILSVTWPKLATLWMIPVGSDLAHSQAVPTRALIPFAHCPDLTSIGFLIDNSEVPDLPPQWRSSSRVNFLALFAINDISSDEAHYLNLFLTDLFPLMWDQLIMSPEGIAVPHALREHEHNWAARLRTVARRLCIASPFQRRCNELRA